MIYYHFVKEQPHTVMKTVPFATPLTINKLKQTPILTFTVRHVVSPIAPRNHPLAIVATQEEAPLACRKLVARVADGAAARVGGAVDPSVSGTGRLAGAGLSEGERGRW